MISLRAVLLIATVTVLMLVAQYAKSEEALLTSDEIYMAQTILFENGYVNVGLPDGVMGPNTREAIRLWQELNGHPMTGLLTNEQVKELADQGIPTDLTWGALSLSVDGQFGTNPWSKSGVAAYRAALAECQAFSELPHKCTTGAVWADQEADGWIAGYWCEAGDYSFVSVSIGISKEVALQSAYGGVEAEKQFKPWQCVPVYFSVTAIPDPLEPEAVVDEEVH